MSERSSQTAAGDRRHPFRRLERQTIEGWMARAFPGRRAGPCAPVAGGRCNTNFRVELDGEPVFLRVYSRGGDVARKEIALHRMLLGRVPVPRVLHFEDADPPWAVLEWLPLEPARGEFGRSAGEILAAIGSIRFDAPGDLGPDLSVRPWPGGPGLVDFVRACLFEGRAGERLGAERTRALWAAVQREARRLDGGPPQSSLVHADYNPANLMIEPGTGRVAAVVDWEFAHSGTPLMDFGNMLREHRGHSPAFVRDFVGGYESMAGELPKDWLEQARLIDLTAHLELLQSVEERGEIHRVALAAIDSTLRELEP